MAKYRVTAIPENFKQYCNDVHNEEKRRELVKLAGNWIYKVIEEFNNKKRDSLYTINDFIVDTAMGLDGQPTGFIVIILGLSYRRSGLDVPKHTLKTSDISFIKEIEEDIFEMIRLPAPYKIAVKLDASYT